VETEIELRKTKEFFYGLKKLRKFNVSLNLKMYLQKIKVTYQNI